MGEVARRNDSGTYFSNVYFQFIPWEKVRSMSIIYRANNKKNKMPAKLVVLSIRLHGSPIVHECDLLHIVDSRKPKACVPICDAISRCSGLDYSFANLSLDSKEWCYQFSSKEGCKQ